MMFGFGKKNNKKNSVDTKKNSVSNVAAKSQTTPKKMPSSNAQLKGNVPLNSNVNGKGQGVRRPSGAAPVARPNPTRNANSARGAAVGSHDAAKITNKAVSEKRAEKDTSKLTKKSDKKQHPKIEITPRGTCHFMLALLASLLLATVLLSLLNFTLYAFNHFDLGFGYDVTIKLEDGSDKTKKFVYDHESVFREKGKSPYICLNKLADSLNLSTVGDNQRIKFYKTTDLSNYIVLENGSRHVIMNGELIYISAPVHISGSQVYLPIDFFENYTSSITVNYDSGSHVMSVVYDINEELSTPKRKVLEEFRFVVTAPVGLEEMTEEERNEYAVLSKG